MRESKLVSSFASARNAGHKAGEDFDTAVSASFPPKTVAVSPAPLTPTTTVGGVVFNNITMEETVSLILLMVQKGDSAQHIVTGNLDHLFMLQRDASFRKIYETSALALPDGAPIVWLSRLKDRTVTQKEEPLQERVAGSDLFWELARASHQTGLRLFFLGGLPGAADSAAEIVRSRYPKAQICGTYCPPFETFNTDEEQANIGEIIRGAAPDVLLVGLGAPKQEKWIMANKDRLGVPVSIGVGGTFEMAAGIVQRAPLRVQKLGMEWAYRLVQDPSRLWRRYLRDDLPFLAKTASRIILGRPHPAPQAPVVSGEDKNLLPETLQSTSTSVTSVFAESHS
jgi:N-acetylglucosaminyldiphosphoundecaprenol N-acetyl-beta-D-mannosaminyltransferase